MTRSPSTISQAIWPIGFSAISAPPSLVCKAFIVPLTDGLISIVDVADAQLVGRYSWSASAGKGLVYARTTLSNGDGLAMHRLVLSAGKGVHVDHINGLTLDNRRANLRIATPSQNARNKRIHRGKKASKYKGVYLCPRLKKPKWTARIYIEGRHYTFNGFATETEAAIAYDEAAIRLFGEFARLNFGRVEDRPHGFGESSYEDFRNAEKTVQRLEQIERDLEI